MSNAPRREADLQTMLYELLRALSQQFDSNAVARLAVGAIASLTDWTHVCIAVPDKEGKHWVVYAAGGNLSSVSGRIFSIGQGVIGRVFRTTQAQCVSQVAADPDYVIGHPATCSELAVPLLDGGCVLGVLNLESERPNAFDSDDVRLAESLAEVIALALENVRLYETTQCELTERKHLEQDLLRRTSQLEAVRQISLELAAGLDLDSTLRSIAGRAVELLGGTNGGLYFYRPNRDVLERCVSVGPRPLPIGTILQRGEGLAGKVLDIGRPLAMDDYSHWEGRTTAYDGYLVSSVIAVPVRWGNLFLGVLTVAAESPRAFSKDDVELAGLLAAQAAIAIRNARALGAEEWERWRAESLTRATTALTNTLEVEPLLENVLIAAAQVIPNAEKGSVLLVDEETRELRVRAIIGYHDPRVRQARFSYHTGYAQQVVEEGRALLISDAWAESIRYDGEIEEARAIQSAIVAPMRYRDRITGVLSLDNASRKAAFVEEDLSLLEAFAAQAAVAIESARLYEQVRASEERYRCISETISDYTYSVRFEPDETPVFEWMTEAYSRVTDYSLVELADRDGWLRLIHPDDVPVVLQHREMSMSGQPDVREFRILDKGGEARWIRNYVRPAWDERQGRVVRVYGAAQDITERKRTEETLQQRHRDLALLNQVSQTLTATLDLQEVTERLVKASAETIGVAGASVWVLDEEQPGGLTCLASSHPDLKHPLVNLRLRPGEGIAGWVAQNGKSVIVPRVSEDPHFFSAIDAQTGFHTVSMLAVPLRVRDKVIGVLQAVNKLNGEFDEHDRALAETLAASAAIALDNARLVEALRRQAAELEARNAELDAFAHTAAHDLKNPLGNIVGYAGVLEQDDAILSDTARLKCLNIISRSGRKMANIIDELLLLAGVREMEVEIEPLDMASIVAEAQQRLLYMIADQVEIILPAAWPVALGYAPWVEEVWVNYLSNAIKYGGRPPRLELGGELLPNPPLPTACERGGGGGMVRFWLRDNGPGLTPEQQTSLFTPFTQLSQVRARGHGLGLSIVRRIVEKLGGQVGIESAGVPGLGSIFYFTLPAAARDM